jgi:hypothetical protein
VDVVHGNKVKSVVIKITNPLHKIIIIVSNPFSSGEREREREERASFITFIYKSEQLAGMVFLRHFHIYNLIVIKCCVICSIWNSYNCSVSVYTLHGLAFCPSSLSTSSKLFLSSNLLL